MAPSRGRLATPARPAPAAVVTVAWRLLAPIRQTKRRELLFAIQEHALRCGWQPAGNDCSSPCPLAVLTADLLQRINGVGERCSPPCLRNRPGGLPSQLITTLLAAGSPEPGSSRLWSTRQPRRCLAGLWVPQALGWCPRTGLYIDPGNNPCLGEGGGDSLCLVRGGGKSPPKHNRLFCGFLVSPGGTWPPAGSGISLGKGMQWHQ